MPTFQYVKPTQSQLEVMQDFRDRYGDLYNHISGSDIPTNRAYYLAITKLEESAMWINKAITENC